MACSGALCDNVAAQLWPFVCQHKPTADQLWANAAYLQGSSLHIRIFLVVTKKATLKSLFLIGNTEK